MNENKTVRPPMPTPEPTEEMLAEWESDATATAHLLEFPTTEYPYRGACRVLSLIAALRASREECARLRETVEMLGAAIRRADLRGLHDA